MPATQVTNRIHQAGAAALCLVHVLGCWMIFGGLANLRSPNPYLVHDFPFRFYYAATAREHFAATWTNSGLDPYFMAGYAKSIVFPSSTNLDEVVVSLFPREWAPQVFKGYVLTLVSSTPFLLWFAGRRFARALGCNDCRLDLLVVFLSVWNHWANWALHYYYLGMVTYGFSGPLLAIALIEILLFVQQPTLARFFAVSVALAGNGLAHVSTFVGLAPVMTFVIALALARRRVAFAGAVLGAGLLGCAANAFWIWPGLLLWSTKGTFATGIGFINPNASERLVNLIRQPQMDSLMLALALAGFTCVWQKQRQAAGLIGASLAWAFFLGYPAGYLRSLDGLQPGRYTYYFGVLAILPGAYACVSLANAFQNRARPRLGAGINASLFLGALLFSGYTVRHTYGSAFDKRTALPTRLPDSHRELLALLKQKTKPGERLLFEDRNQGLRINPTQMAVDPFGDFRLSPLVPLQTGLEVIGGPYLYTHLKTNFTQFGDGKIFGKDGLSTTQFWQYVETYQIDWVVVWSPAMQNFCLAVPDRLEIAGKVGGWFTLAKVRSREPSKVKVQAMHGRLRVQNNPPKGPITLPYHWLPTLRCVPRGRIEPIYLLDDPAPFLQVFDAPERFEIVHDYTPGR